MNIFDFEQKYLKDVHVYEINEIYTEEKAKEIVNDFKNALKGKKIVFWGAGTIGRAFYNLAQELKFSVSAVIDRQGKNANFPYDVEILSADDPAIKNICNNALIIATANRSLFNNIKKDISDAGIFLDNVICGQELHMITKLALCMLKVYDPNGKIIVKNCYECINSEKSCLALNHYLKRVNVFVTAGNTTGGGIFSKSVRMMGYSLGTICTLRCGSTLGSALQQ